MKTKIKNIIIACVLLIVMLTSTACGNAGVKKLYKHLTQNGSYDAKYEQYSIQLSSDVKLYTYKGDNDFNISYYDYSDGEIIRFYINYRKGTDYGWSFYYDDYKLYGEIEASDFTSSTTYLYYDSTSTDSIYSSINLELKKLSATLFKVCLLELKSYLLDSNSGITLADLGFTNY